MFSFFNKKYFLKDLLEDFVDIHNHILPGIDDGAKTIADSLILIENMRNLGIKQFIPTPHVMHDFYPNTDDTIGNSYQNVLEALDPKTLSEITINPAAEYMLDIHFEKFLEDNYLFTLKSNHVLVELSYFQPPINLEDIIYKIKSKGYIPILAHPERYAYYHKNLEYYKRLKSLGCLFQLNLLSLGNHYGSNVNKTAYTLIEHGLIDFVGTDVHNLNHINKLSDLRLSKKNTIHLAQIIRNTNQTFSVI
jgi:protein-tyrosine phosphatase